jgi:protein-disulfide isomerase
MDHPQTGFEKRGVEEDLVLAPVPVEIKIYTSPFSSYGEDYRKGGDNAKVQLVEFSDFQCPACQQATKVVDQLSEEFGDALLVVYKNYPLDDKCNPKVQNKFHDYACDAAFLARCAGRYGRFWEFNRIVYENQPQLSTENLHKWAKQVGLNDEQIKECLNSKDIQEKIKSDVEAGEKAGVEGTPTLFINGLRVVDWRSVESLSHKIRQLMAQ